MRFNSQSSDANTVGSSVTQPGVAEFYVGSNPFPAGTGLQSSPGFSTTTFSLATSTCNLTSVAGCFQNALVWAFFPSQSMLTLISSAGNQVKYKPPFGYFFVNLDEIRALNASGTPPTALATMAPLTTYFFHPVDVALASIVGFFTLVGLFHRARHIEV